MEDVVYSGKNKLIGYVISDVGLVRDNNEDNFLLGHCLNEHGEKHWESHLCHSVGQWTCAAVFDGMGGAEGGEIASHLAAQVFQEKTLDLIGLDKGKITEILEDSFSEANAAVIEERKHHSTCGTTGVAVATDGQEFCVFYRGDSRAYLMRNKQLYLLSKDHTLAQLKLDVGIYHSRDEVPEKENHQLTEFIGMDDSLGSAKPSTSQWMEWQTGDRILLCSDGLYDMCENEELLEFLKRDDNAEQAAKSLMQVALKNGGKDNVTILILEQI